MKDNGKIKILISVPADVYWLTQGMLNNLAWNNSAPITQSELWVSAMREYYIKKVMENK